MLLRLPFAAAASCHRLPVNGRLHPERTSQMTARSPLFAACRGERSAPTPGSPACRVLPRRVMPPAWAGTAARPVAGRPR